MNKKVKQRFEAEARAYIKVIHDCAEHKDKCSIEEHLTQLMPIIEKAYKAAHEKVEEKTTT